MNKKELRDIKLFFEEFLCRKKDCPLCETLRSKYKELIIKLKGGKR